MEKEDQRPKDTEKKDGVEKTENHPLEKEFDADDAVHKTSPDLIQQEDNHLPVDDEVKKG